jgi:non-heme chloroperoxidase
MLVYNRCVWLLTAAALLTILPNPDRAAGSEPASRFLTVNGARLEYLEWGGQGTPLVFIAGLGDTPYIYNDLAPEFRSRYRCFGLTRRGFGRSEQTAGGYELDDLVSDIAGFLSALNLKEVTLIGHSFGAIEVMRTAELHPDLIRRMVLLDPAFTAPDSLGRAQTKLLAALGMTPAQRQSSLNSYREYRKFMLRGWSEAAEANLHEQLTINSDGTVQSRTPGRVNEAVNKDRSGWKITRIAVPGLLFLAHNHLTDFVEGRQIDQQTMTEVIQATAEADAADQARVEAFRRDSPRARIVELDHTDHHCFIQRREKVVDEMQHFLP